MLLQFKVSIKSSDPEVLQKQAPNGEDDIVDRVMLFCRVRLKIMLNTFVE